jgi:hypothetical protein
MSSKLEQFIKEHRSEFNDERPSKNVWDEIETTLPAQNKKAKVVSLGNVYKLMAAAAVVCIVLTSVYFVYFKEKTDKPAITQQPIQEMSPEYKSQINREFEVIQTRQQELKAATADNPELYKAFLSDLQILDSTYQMLQKQAATTPNRDVIIKAMMQNLKLQSELLYRQLMISNDFKKNNEPVNEPVQKDGARANDQQQQKII